MEDALRAAPFMASHMDPAFLEERAVMADAVMAQRPLQGGLLDSVAALPARRRELLLGARYATAMTEPRHLPLLDRELEHAACVGILGELIDFMAAQLQDHLANTVDALLPVWSRERASSPRG